MSTFEQSRHLFNQTHFSVIEIDVPVVEGDCTVGGEPGYGTPLSCSQPSNALRTYKFTGIDAPLMPESGILRIVKKISETPAKLNIDKGLASRGTGSITFIDITSKDPNPDAPAVTAKVIAQGAFISKLVARNQLTNRAIRIKNYRLEEDGTIDLLNGAETRHYIIDTVNAGKNGEWSFKFKDELSKINIGDSSWPIPLEGHLRVDIDDSVTTIPVDAGVTYIVGDTIRASDELIKVSSVSNIGTASATVTVPVRGSDISYTNLLTRVNADEHEQNDELFVCEVSDNERIDDLLERILIDVGIDPLFIPKADWTAEINEWHPASRVNTIWIESKPTSDVLKEILTNFMIDMWFDPVARQVKISAISAWKESTATLTEGNEINYESVSKKRNEGLRSTRARIVYNKPFIANDDKITSYSKASIFKRTELESDDLFGEPKLKEFDFTNVIDEDSADLLVNRWVNRFVNPADYTFKTPERKLTYSVGDVVDTSIIADVGFNGLQGSNDRIQITSITPNYNSLGREYTTTGLSYEPILSDESEIIITGSAQEVNLYTQYAGAPNQAVTITIIFDGTVGSSNDNVTPSIKAGAFPAGSKLIIILANGATLKAKGGDGGDGGGYRTAEIPKNGESGGIVYDAQGVDTDIYFSGATPSVNYPVADGYILAPSGGAGGFSQEFGEGDDSEEIDLHGKGGNGGDGSDVGVAGFSGSNTSGNDGKVDGTTTGWGQDGVNNNATGGAKGKGIIDNGATVNLFGSTAARYVNGGGDH